MKKSLLLLSMAALIASLLSGVLSTKALGIPQIKIIKPESPQPVGICVIVVAEVTSSSDFGKMRIKFANEEWQETTTTEIKRTFCTNQYEPGVYRIRVEAAELGDNDWSHPTIAEADYELKDISDFYPGQVAIFGTLRQVFPAQIGQELYIIRLRERQRWLVPNKETAEALCLGWGNKPGNIWDVPDSELLKYPKGPDVPDINTNPDAFWEFRNKYFLPCDPSVFIQSVASPTVEPNSQGTDRGLIAFVRNSNIYLISPDGTGERQLTSNGGYSDPAWSPDGSTIAYVRRKDIDQSGGQATYIGLLDVNTLQEQTLVEPQVSPLPSIPPSPPTYDIFDRLKWSPDGQSIYFHTFNGRASEKRIWKVDLGGNILTEDVFSNNRENNIALFDVSPTDGKIVYVRLWGAPPDRGNGLSVTDENGNLLNEILPVSTDTYINFLCWSWNGQRVNYTSSADPTFGGRDNISWIDAIKTDDRGIRLDLPQMPQGLACSPYNDDFVYVIDEALIIFNEDAGTTLNLTQGIQPSWGRAIFNRISDTISGQIIDFNTNNAIPDVIVSDDQGHTTQTDVDGNFTISDLRPGTYTIKPEKSGFIFSPPSRTITIPPNASEQDFTGSGDLDGDGLYDIWEVKGYDANGDGTIDVELPKMGADPNHIDIFVEVDYMVEKSCVRNICIILHSHLPNRDAIAQVVEAFKDAPLSNIDGIHGIDLHVDLGPDSLMKEGESWRSLSGSNEIPHDDELNWDEFYDLKRTNFDSGRSGIFHYAISAHHYEDLFSGGICESGSGQMPGFDFMITLGGYSRLVPEIRGLEAAPCTAPIRRHATGTVWQQAGTFMHELGHNLGLDHGGNDPVNFKPNYLSVMNYSFQLTGLFYDNDFGGKFDYSRTNRIPDLLETRLDEGVGLNGGSSTARYGTLWSCPNGSIERIQNANDPINWNCNNADNETVFSANINNFAPYVSEPNETLRTFFDWDNLVFDGGRGSTREGIVEISEGSIPTEITLQQYLLLPHPYEVELAGPSGIIATPGYSTKLMYSLVNTGENQDTYTLTATSSLGWANLGSIPREITLAPGETRDFSISIGIPETADREDKDTIKLLATSTKNPALWTSFYAITAVTLDQEGQRSGMSWFLYVILILAVSVLLVLGMRAPSYLRRNRISSVARPEGQTEHIEKYCRNCGAKLPSEGRFCPKCGTARR